MSTTAPPEVESIRSAFQGDVVRPRLSLSYRLWFVAGLAAAIVMPLLYLALTLGLMALTILHGVESSGLLMPRSGMSPGMVFARWVLYFGGLFFGATLVIFLLKPLAAFRPRYGELRALRREDEPVLFAFVDEIAGRLGAPKPHRIVVDLDMNAGAGFTGGPLGFVLGRLRLVIGLPLVAAMSQRALGGVIAHELGHFRQGSAMRLGRIIGSVAEWFAERVFGKDGWDEWIDRQASEIPPPFSFPFYAAKFGAWMVRKLLFAMLFVTHAILCRLMREQEFDADGSEVAIAGSETFVETVYRLHKLRYCHHAAMALQGLSAREHRLVDSLPALIAGRMEEFPKDLLIEIEKEIDGGRTGLFHTHPCDRERIAAADRIGGAGVLRTDAPATTLFRDFHAIAREHTVAYYRAMFGPNFREEMLATTQAVQAHREELDERLKAQRRFFQRTLHPTMACPVEDRDIPPPTNPQETGRVMMDARARAERLAPAALLLARDYDRACNDVIRASAATALFEQGFTMEPGTFGLANPTRAGANELFRSASIRQREAAEKLREFHKASAERLFAALQLLHVPVVREHLKDKAVEPTEARRLLGVVARVGWGLDFARDLHREFIMLEALFRALQAIGGQDEKLARRVQKQLTACHTQIVHLHNCFAEDRYPFEHTSKDMTIGTWLVPEIPHPFDAPAIARLSDNAPERFYLLYYRLLGELALIGERVELAFRLQPMPDPPPWDEEPG